MEHAKHVSLDIISRKPAINHVKSVMIQKFLLAASFARLVDLEKFRRIINAFHALNRRNTLLTTELNALTNVDKMKVPLTENVKAAPQERIWTIKNARGVPPANTRHLELLNVKVAPGQLFLTMTNLIVFPAVEQLHI